MHVRLTLVMAILIASLVPTRAARQPNILWIMSDDHAAHAIGAYGGRLAALNPMPTLNGGVSPERQTLTSK